MSSSLNHSGFIQGDCLEVLATLPAGCADLVFGSPPYEQARLYLRRGLGIDLRASQLTVCGACVSAVATGRACAGRRRP